MKREYKRLLSRILPILALVVGVAAPQHVLAQAPVTALERLDVDIWPDYDDPSILVIMSATLPADTPLPATVVVPLPDDASLNAVARVSSDNQLMADVDYDESVPGQLSLTTPDPRFRVEYYAPYEADGNERNFTFDWRSEMTVFELLVSVQQPLLANGVSLIPAAAGVSTRQDGLQYHDLPAQSIPEGDSFTLEGSYTLTRPGLTVDLLQREQPGQSIPTPVAAGGSAAGAAAFNWPVLLAAMGAVLAIGAVAWFFLRGRRPSKRVAKPRPVRAPKARPGSSKATSAPASRKAKFCHECGQPASPGDRFCSNCGTALRDIG